MVLGSFFAIFKRKRNDKGSEQKPKESFLIRYKKSFFHSKVVEFCNRTDLHGYKYIVMDGLNSFERFCWGLAVICSLVIGTYFVITAYNWYARNPIITVIESTQAAIWDVPFPAVTICDLNLISRKAAYNFSNTVSLTPNVTAQVILEALRYAPLLHSTYKMTPLQKQYLTALQAVLDLNNISIESLFRQLSPVVECNRLIERCMWKNTVYRCSNLFQQIFTMSNLCCAFNYFAVEPSDASFKPTGSKQYPRRVASCGYQSALTVLVNTDPDDYYSTFVASQGALVYIDDAYNVPDMDSPVRLVGPFTEVMIALSPERTYSTSGIRAFHPEQRQCYFIDENKIGILRQYSFHNCIASRKMELLRMACRCVPFFYPTKGDKYRICNFNDVDCLEHVITSYGLDLDTDKLERCWPECEHFNYQFEVAVGTLSSNIHLNGHPFFKDLNLENRSLLNVFFNDLVSTKYRRDVYLNWQNILASFGGLLSLVLGFTLISGFDCILFTCSAIFTYLKKYIAKNRDSAKISVNKISVQPHFKDNNWLKKNKNIKGTPSLSRW